MRYVQRVPPKPKAGVFNRWHKGITDNNERTACGLRIGKHWNQTDEEPPSGEPACVSKYCFGAGHTP